MVKRAKIIGTGSYLPDKILTNFDLEQIVDTSNDWIIKRTGIKERRIAQDGLVCSDLGSEASLRAVEMSGLSPEDIDAIIVGTVTADMISPSAACMVQTKIGAKNAVAFDISAGCSGFIYALSIADCFISTGKFKNVLIIGCETLSKITDYQDRSTCVLFGDGAGAAVLTGTSEEDGVVSTHICSDGSTWNLLYVPAGGSAIPASQESISDRLHYIRMDGNKLFKVAVKSLEDVSLEVLRNTNLTCNDIKLMITHQANLRIIDQVGEKLGVPSEKVYTNIQRVGNTSAASIPIALDEVHRAGLINKGDVILLSAFGSGLTSGSAVIKW
ncbi:MAG: beta-ketoacyl-ACP synthase III [Thermodesulfobacteriota bacterium]|nr:beta-ketoacyl-ACP synthase III [Thermodesulfobacteriota bacterium]